MMKRRRKRKNKSSGLGITIFIVFSICGSVMIKQHSLNQDHVIAYARMEELEEDIREQEQISEDLEEQKARMQTRKFIEDTARDKFGLVYEDEYIFKASEE